ncbi:Coq4 family protein [Erythrobacter sp. THAF29]|uniref:Coq4 family protein n=1 Tax=Erythrobacter sp. THAF29 TaxID=2587851 RepID=UPI00126825D9|nr:Coq4 family protein [Erythrobacter sp. THAF29]QFT77775.1 Coenzyme Q (ubiquinone) biosynthesis protein Coq4 [Erythrobacter sp. THAF29]
MALLDRPLVSPDRTVSGFQPRKVLHHFGKLVEDKEDTEQVFHIIEATKGKKSHRQAWEFIQSEDGQRFLRSEVDLPAMLDNHDRWADLPDNSVGKHYMAFMKREGLTARGLVEESHKWAPPESRPDDLTEWYFNRLRDTHDLFHVLTGYGRDALGEASLLGFSYSQNHNNGILFIAFAGARQIKKTTGTKAPLYAAVREGKRNGKAAAKLAHMDVEMVMREDIDEARARLSIREPSIYRECLKILETEGHLASELGLSEPRPQIDCCDGPGPQAA